MSFNSKIENEIIIDDDRRVRIELKEGGIRLTWFYASGPVEMATCVSLTEQGAMAALEALSEYASFLENPND